MYNKREEEIQMSVIAVKIPEAILYDTRMNESETEKFIRRLVALEYYKNQGVSIGYCAEIAGMTEEEFIKYLGEKNISIFQFDDEEEFLGEANNA